MNSARWMTVCVVMAGLGWAGGTGCAKPRPVPVEGPPRGGLLFESSPGLPEATEIGRSDWPSAPGAVESPRFDLKYETIYDYQGGGNYGWGSWGGGWNNYHRRVMTYRVGTAVR
ncbi:MAG: hypothetical protein U1A27_13525 [Phycisphaerae bacterium]